MSAVNLDHLRHYAVSRTLFAPTTLGRAIARLGFVQADPIRAPARAQDLTLRYRVENYRAGDLERSYARLAIEEDCLVNYGFLPRAHLALMHPRTPKSAWNAVTKRRAADVQAFIRERGPTRPSEIRQHFSHGRVSNYWGGTMEATTKLLDEMHYRGLLRVARRDAGTRVYAAVEHPTVDQSAAARAERAAALLDLVVHKYAPLPSPSLGYLASLLGYGAPHLSEHTRAWVRAARERYAHADIDGLTWYWPADEKPRSARHAPADAVRLFAPFDPVVWDRRRFELLWGWAYRFEAYTPAPRRKLGYYALPLLWREQVIGWANVEAKAGRVDCRFGYASGKAPREPAFRRALEAEVDGMKRFLAPRDDS